MKSLLRYSWLTKEPSSSEDAAKAPASAQRGTLRRAASSGSTSFETGHDRSMLHPSLPSHKGKLTLKDGGWVDRPRPTVPLELVPTRKSSLKSSPPRLNRPSKGHTNSIPELGERRCARSSSLRLPSPDHSRSPPAPCLRPRPPRSAPPRNAARSARRVRFCTPEDLKDSARTSSSSVTLLEDVKEEGREEDVEFDPLEMYGGISEVKDGPAVCDRRCHTPPILDRQDTSEESVSESSVSIASSSDSIFSDASTEEIFTPRNIPSLLSSESNKITSKPIKGETSVYDNDSSSSSSLPYIASFECLAPHSSVVGTQIVPNAHDGVSDQAGSELNLIASTSRSGPGAPSPNTSQTPDMPLQTKHSGPSEHLPVIEVNTSLYQPIAINFKRSRSGSGVLVSSSYTSSYITKTTPRSSSREPGSRNPSATSAMLNAPRLVTTSSLTSSVPSDANGSPSNQTPRKSLPLPHSVPPVRRILQGSAPVESVASQPETGTPHMSQTRGLPHPGGLYTHLPKTRTVSVLNFVSK
jgi:hypothetical protein